MRTSLRVFFTLLALFSISYACVDDAKDQDIQLLDIEEDTRSLQEGRVLASSSYPNIRIYAYYEYVKSTASSSYASYIENDLIPPAVDYFQAALRVKSPVADKLVLSSSSMCERSTPSILRSGVDADFFIYFDTEATSDSQIASTKYCYLASGTKRPLVARTMINRNMMPAANDDVLQHEKNMYTIMHEMMHAFGFSTNLYDYFIDSNGNTLRGHVKSIKVNGNTRTFIDVAPLTEKLREHYGCPSLEGALMENGGGSGTSASHFERKVFLYEFMTSGSILGRRVSELSLALLEGSGWYAPDYDYAEPYFFGKGQGCSFITGSSCTNFDEFCSGSSRGCTPTGRGGGSCDSDSISDGCKYYKPIEDYDCENEDGQDYARLPDLQVYGRGAGSKCFTGTLNTRSSSSEASFCFKYTCSGSGSDATLQVQVGGNQITCTKAGSQTIDGYYGAVNCPDPQTFCSTVGLKYCPRNCMGRGTCSDGRCQCDSGYTGVDCALRA